LIPFLLATNTRGKTTNRGAKTRPERQEQRIVVKKVAIQKRYKDQDGNRQHTNSFGLNDLPKLVLVATKAYDYLIVKKEGEGSHGYNRFPQG
ncbi:MAG: hypothetical protein HWN71_06145, partial [Desulfobacterales bacterium]|nr:hypothetical protein [Desulfobacterales bacterium]